MFKQSFSFILNYSILNIMNITIIYIGSLFIRANGTEHLHFLIMALILSHLNVSSFVVATHNFGATPPKEMNWNFSFSLLLPLQLHNNTLRTSVIKTRMVVICHPEKWSPSKSFPFNCLQFHFSDAESCMRLSAAVSSMKTGCSY